MKFRPEDEKPPFAQLDSTPISSLTRPGELLGSYANANRTLRRSTIVWHHKPPPLAKGPSAPSLSASPQGNSSISHFTIDLGVTKADPTGSNPPVVIAALAAIDALKQWMDLQGDIGPSSILFRVAGEGALRMKELLDWCADCYAASGAPRPLFQGKGFRKGGPALRLLKGPLAPTLPRKGGGRLPPWSRCMPMRRPRRRE